MILTVTLTLTVFVTLTDSLTLTISVTVTYTVYSSSIMLLDTSDVVHLVLGGCKTITDQCLIDMVKRSQKPRMAHLESREKVIEQVCQRRV